MHLTVWIRLSLVFAGILALLQLQMSLITSVVLGKQWLIPFGLHLLILMYILRELAGNRTEGFRYQAFAVTFAVIMLAPRDPLGTWYGVLLFNVLLSLAAMHISYGWVTARR